MQKLLMISRYHLNIIVIYILLAPFFFYLFQNGLRYDFSYNHLVLQVEIVILTLTAFFFFLFQKIEKINFKFSVAIGALLYGIIFAVPEEIIFRGIIQGSILSSFNTYAILISSFVFGLAHLLNGAKSFYPSGWNWRLFALTFLVGIPLGTLFYLSGSLLIPTLLHILFVTCLKIFKK